MARRSPRRRGEKLLLTESDVATTAAGCADMSCHMHELGNDVVGDGYQILGDVDSGAKGGIEANCMHS